MKCPNGRNEISQDEVFCGQCGAPSISSAKPTEMVQTPPSYNRQLNSGYNTQLSPTAGAYTAGAQPPAQPAGVYPPNPNQSAIRPAGPQQQGDFYQDATEAMSVLPNSGQNYPAGYPQQGFPGVSEQGGYPGTGQYGQPMQPFQTGNFSGTSYPPSQPYQVGQVYGMRPGPTPPPKQRNGAVLVIAIICFAFAIIAVSAFGILYLVHKNQANLRPTPTPAVTATTPPSPSPSPSPTPSPSPSPTMTPSPSPTPSPTATADTGFVLCDTTCTTNGFTIEYPTGWLQSTPDTSTIEFNSPTQTDVYALFRTPGMTSSNANNLVMTDLTNNYAMKKTGYVAPTSTSNTTIGGANWTYAIAMYQLNGAAERVEVFATVYQNKAYIIELQAPDAQFDMLNTSYFEPMLNRFQFQ